MNKFTVECEPTFETCEFVHLWAQLQKRLSQGSSYGLTCVGQNKDTNKTLFELLNTRLE